MFPKNVFSKRFASAARSLLLPSIEENISRLSNGLTVASVELNGAVSQILIAFKGGSRYEQPNEVGLVHHLRNNIGTDSVNYLGIKLLWQSGSIGSTLTSSASKDLLTVHLSVNRTFANVGLSLLGEFAQPAYKPWNTNDLFPTLYNDIEQQQPLDIVLECLHAAAYRDGPLANRILSPVERVGKINYKQLVAFGQSRLVTSQAIIVGINVDHSILTGYANTQNSIKDSKFSKTTQPSPYHGGDVRIYGDTPLAHVIIAGNGAKLSDYKSTATFAVLSYIIGKASNIKYNNSSSFGTIARTVHKAANHNSVAINAINIVHSDEGLAGVYLVSDGTKIQPYVKAAVEALKNLALSGIDAESLEIAKKFVLVDTSVMATDSFSLAQDRAAQFLLSDSEHSIANYLNLVESITSDDIKKAALQIVSKLSIAAYGKINQVPYVDQL